MGFRDIIAAEFRFTYADVFRRKITLVTFIAYPYILTILVLLIGYSLGSPTVFRERVGIDPMVFFILAGFTIMAIIGVGDDLLWRPLFDEWMGTLPYVMASPVPRIQHYIAIPLPRLILVLISGSTSIVPVLTYYYGLQGLVEGLLVMLLTGIAALFFTTIAILIMGIVYSLGGENWRIINIIRPLFLILVGAYYPRYLMPLTGQVISWLIPSSHVVEVIHRMISGLYSSPVDLLVLLGIATALFILYAPPGVKSIMYWEKTKMREGVRV